MEGEMKIKFEWKSNSTNYGDRSGIATFHTESGSITIPFSDSRYAIAIDKMLDNQFKNGVKSGIDTMYRHVESEWLKS
jgi:hypothetical protein